MTIFRSMMLGAMLAAPVMASAVTTTTLTSSTAGTSILSQNYDAQGNGGGITKVPTGGSFTDIWTIDVGAGDSAEVSFKENPLNVSGFQVWQIAGFNVATAPFVGLAAGSHTFTVTGTKVTGFTGGSYSFGTVVSAVPVPGAVWLMGSALVGLVSFGRRKVGLAA